MDGSIRVVTKLDTKGVKPDLKKLESECEKTAEKIESVGQRVKSVFTGIPMGQLNSSFKTANRELGKTKAELDKIQKKISEAQEVTDAMLPHARTDDQARTLLEMEEQELAPLLAKRDELTKKADEYKRQLKDISAEINRQTQLQEAQKTLDANSKTAVADAAWLGKIQTEKEYHALLDTTREKMAIIEQEAAKISQQSGIPTSNLLQQNGQYQELARRATVLVSNQDRFKGKVDESAEAMKHLKDSANSAGNAIKRSISDSIKRIARMGMAVIGVRSAFMVLRRAASMYMQDNQELQSQLNGLWNVLATAIGPAVERVINLLSVAVSYVNAFIKALTGVDLVARANAKALNKQASATAAAAKASRQLAGFDEMNKLSDTSSSGGGGADNASVFKTTDVDTSKVEKFAEFVDKIKEAVYGVGAGLLTWKVLNSFGVSLKNCSLWALIIAGAVASIASYVDMIENGVDWANLSTLIGGIAAVATGLGILFGAIAASISVIVGGVLAVTAGFKDWLENGKSVEALSAISAGLIAIATAIGVILFVAIEAVAWWAILIAAAIGAVIAAGVAVVMYWDEVKEAAKTVWDWIDENIISKLAEFFAPMVESAKNAWEWIYGSLIQPILSGIGEMLAAVIEVAKYIISKVSEIVSGVVTAISAILAKFVEIYNKIKEIIVALWGAFVTYIWKPLTDKLRTFYDEKIKPIIDKIATVLKGVKAFIQKHIIDPFVERFNWVKDKAISIFKTVGIAVADFFGGVVKSVINGVLSSMESRINGFIRLLNGAINIINKIPGVDISHVSTLSIPRLARGGIVNNPGRGVLATIGEAGAEAVLPLEHNTEWMDILAEKIGGNVTIPIYMDGKKIATYVVDIQKKRAFALNGA